MKMENSLESIRQKFSKLHNPSDGKFTLYSVISIMLFAIPLIINPGIFSTFEETYLYPRLWWIYGIVFPSTLLLLANWSKPKLDVRVIWLLSAFLLWLCLSVLFTSAGWLGWWGQTDRADGVLMHVIYGLLLVCGWHWFKNDPQALSKFSKALLVGGGLLALTAVLQQVHILGVSNPNAFSGIMPTPFGGTLGNRGYMGGALALFLPIALWGYRRADLSPVWSCVALILITWGWAGSLTRGAWIAGAVAIAALFFGRYVDRRGTKIFALGLAFWLASSFVFGNFDQLNSKLAQGTESSGRTVLWKSALYGIGERPIFGWGTPALIKVLNDRPVESLFKESGLHNVASARRMNTMEAQDLPRYTVTYTDGRREQVTLGGVNKVHNEYLDYALTYGLPAAILFTVLLAWAIWSARFAAPGLSAGLLAYAVYLFTWPEIVRFAPIAWFIMGMALASNKRR